MPWPGHGSGLGAGLALSPKAHLHSMWSILCIDHIRHLVCIECVIFGTPYTRVMYGIRQCNRIFLSGEIGAFFSEIFFQISVVILNSNLHYQIFKFVIDNSDISLNCLQHIQKRRNFDAKVTYVTSQFVYCYMPY